MSLRTGLGLSCTCYANAGLERNSAQNVWGKSLGMGLGEGEQQQGRAERQGQKEKWWQGGEGRGVKGRAGQVLWREGRGKCCGGRARARVWLAPCRRSRASRASGWHLGVGVPPTQRAPVDTGDSLSPEHAERSVSARGQLWYQAVTLSSTMWPSLRLPFNLLLRTGTLLGAGGLCGGSTSIAATSHSLTEIPSTCKGAEGVRWRCLRPAGVKRACGVVQISGCGGLFTG